MKTRLLYRVIDANLNRLKEGIRVCEDIQRYIHNDKTTAKALKNLRHRAKLPKQKKLLKNRDILNDPLKQTTKSEKNRVDIEHIQIANFKRAQESARVLEEVLKLIDTKHSAIFKSIRYELYGLEKSILV